MKKLLTISFILILLMTQAQTKFFFYGYKFIPDSDNQSDGKTEIMVLDIDTNGSSYFQPCDKVWKA